MAAPKRELTLFDSVCIIVGIIIGVGIFETAPSIAGSAADWQQLLGFWLLGGVLSLAGAFCYAELACAYPQEGGDYVYLKRAYGNWAGFLFAWAQLIIIRPGSIAAMAFPFARYAQNLSVSTTTSSEQSVLYASLAVIILTAINIAGVRGGKLTQNVLTVFKVLGLLVIFATIFFAPSVQITAAAGGPLNISLAIILILFTFGGWNELAYVAAEVKEPQKNIFRALVFGTLAVTLLYILVNAAFLFVLGYPKFAASGAVATDTVAAVFPGYAAKFVAALICLSALGAVNGMIFTGARISYAMGGEHRGFGLLANWSSRLGTPVWALIVQGVLSLAIIIWAGSFNQTVVYTTTVVWLFFLATGISVFVLRKKEPDTPRPHKVWGYPITPLVFCASCLFLIVSALGYDLKGSLISLGILAIGAVVYFVTAAPAARAQS